MANQLALILVGSTFKRINISDIEALTVVVPPKSEQEAICGVLDLELTTFDDAIRRVHREIDLLREYRTRLIADVVTGKLDVRAAAAALPQDELSSTLEPEALDPMDASNVEAELEE